MAKVSFDSQDSKCDNAKIENSLEVNNISSSMDVSSAVTHKEIVEDIVNDPNMIKVTIADSTTPLIILFGPPSCGKTMTLIRLAKYLRSINGYTIQPVTSFRPASDKNYEEICANFDSLINSDRAAESTSRINFMLVRVLYKGKALCQILEAPGEHYYNPDIPKGKVEDVRYLNTIINSKNRKIWAIMVEPDNTNKRMGVQERKDYVNKIASLKTKIDVHDKILFVFNKIDETPFIIGPGRVRRGEAMKEVQDLYPNIFLPFKNQNPITRLWKDNNFDFIPFQTGSYSRTMDGILTFEQGHDIYPANLWKTVVKLIRG